MAKTIAENLLDRLEELWFNYTKINPLTPQIRDVQKMKIDEYFGIWQKQKELNQKLGDI
jgi:hypothetical protein